MQQERLQSDFKEELDINPKYDDTKLKDIKILYMFIEKGIKPENTTDKELLRKSHDAAMHYLQKYKSKKLHAFINKASLKIEFDLDIDELNYEDKNVILNLYLVYAIIYICEEHISNNPQLAHNDQQLEKFRLFDNDKVAQHLLAIEEANTILSKWGKAGSDPVIICRRYLKRYQANTKGNPYGQRQESEQIDSLIGFLTGNKESPSLTVRFKDTLKRTTSGRIQRTTSRMKSKELTTDDPPETTSISVGAKT